MVGRAASVRFLDIAFDHVGDCASACAVNASAVVSAKEADCLCFSVTNVGGDLCAFDVSVESVKLDFKLLSVDGDVNVGDVSAVLVHVSIKTDESRSRKL